jgi:hypothetical protein
VRPDPVGAFLFLARGIPDSLPQSGIERHLQRPLALS